ncbi:TIGR00730 family Rossman fold protein [Fulvivirgaceae bacterium BMA10]|uniref:Cytokinin riboside 5'-monophosphate phosphoribohydrolase n=1 Tax=Splendidivirga corallicola TaxID=3051826 RepID=A0ABT8KI54_9BACT|nr:TIGR00730 family Rossman fold protein [Fulvivirgaceae bacterium BMA10]
MKSICVFCGSSFGNRKIYKETSRELGKILAENNIRLVYGGGNVGLMGAIADSVLNEGGEVVGVIPQSLVNREKAHDGLTQIHVVKTMHERKDLMYKLSDAFIAMPGGFGTLDEFCEIFTWFQLGIHKKKIGFLNIEGYFDHLLEHFVRSVEEGFVDQTLYNEIKIECTPENIVWAILNNQ